VLEFYLPSHRWPSSFGWGSPIPFLAIFAVLALCNGLLSWWVASGIVAPLARLRDAALRIGEGDLDSAFHPSGIDEFGEVGSAFETMRAKLKAALERQLAEEKARKELIAHVSHDLRTPIAVIRGHAEGLRDGVASNPEMRARYLAAVLERAKELEALIETLFDYTRMDLDGAEPATMALELAAFLAEARASIGAAFPAASISVAPSPAPTGGEKALHVLADPASILRVLMNLTENSVKHCGSRAVAIEWRTRSFDGKVELSVTDDGEGVPPEDLGRLFEPFFRGDRARARGGSGLGLTIVRKIMEAQGGSARAAAAPTGGLEIALLFREARSDGEADTDRRG
ncbi:MAG: HAMP domain-containing sensor histidine kinase, partial [Spirochaetaceae bacterium]|nr:HAMP domain-containing sensor histidine kinase [Spirochaetaceae bacterium]